MSHESWESVDFKTVLTLAYGSFQTKVIEPLNTDVHVL